MLTIANRQVDSPGAVTVARVVTRESRTEYHALHLLSDSTTLSWQKADKHFNLHMQAVMHSPQKKKKV